MKLTDIEQRIQAAIFPVLRRAEVVVYELRRPQPKGKHRADDQW